MWKWFFCLVVFELSTIALFFAYSDAPLAQSLFGAWFVFGVWTYLKWDDRRKATKNPWNTFMKNNCVECGKKKTELFGKKVCWNCGNNITDEDLYYIAQEEHFPDDSDLHAEMRDVWVKRMKTNFLTNRR